MRVLIVPNNAATEAARKATAIIPVVMVASIDPVVAGFVTTLARPGGNITGVANLSRDLSAKRIEMLQEIFPRLSRLAILRDADGPGPKIAFRNHETAAQALNVPVQSFAIRGQKPELDAAFQSVKKAGPEAMIAVLHAAGLRRHRSRGGHGRAGRVRVCPGSAMMKRVRGSPRDGAGSGPAGRPAPCPHFAPPASSGYR